jgi:hypothetical protein
MAVNYDTPEDRSIWDTYTFSEPVLSNIGGRERVEVYHFSGNRRSLDLAKGYKLVLLILNQKQLAGP